MEPTEALAELMHLSSQVEDAVIVGGSGFVLASSGTPERGEQLARVGTKLLEEAADMRPAADIARIQISLGSTSVFVVAESGRMIVATTVAEPTAGLVLYDLRTALRRLDDEPAPKRPRRKKKDVTDA